MESTPDQLLEIQQAYIQAKEDLNHNKELVDNLKNQILELSNHQSFKGRLLSLKVGSRIGSINYKKIMNKYKISPETQESYRGEPTTTFTLTINKKQSTDS